MRLIFTKVKNGVVHKLCSGLHGCGKYLHPDCFSLYKTKEGLSRQKSKCKECCKVYMRSFKAGDKSIQGMDKDSYIDLQHQEITAQQVVNYPKITGPSTMYSNQWWLDTATSPTKLKMRNTANDAWISVITGMFGY